MFDKIKLSIPLDEELDGACSSYDKATGKCIDTGNFCDGCYTCYMGLDMQDLV